MSQSSSPSTRSVGSGSQGTRNNSDQEATPSITNVPDELSRPPDEGEQGTASHNGGSSDSNLLNTVTSSITDDESPPSRDNDLIQQETTVDHVNVGENHDDESMSQATGGTYTRGVDAINSIAFLLSPDSVPIPRRRPMVTTPRSHTSTDTEQPHTGNGSANSNGPVPAIADIPSQQSFGSNLAEGSDLFGRSFHETQVEPPVEDDDDDPQGHAPDEGRMGNTQGHPPDEGGVSNVANGGTLDVVPEDSQMVVYNGGNESEVVDFGKDAQIPGGIRFTDVFQNIDSFQFNGPGNILPMSITTQATASNAITFVDPRVPTESLDYSRKDAFGTPITPREG